MHWCTFFLALAVPALSMPVASNQATPAPAPETAPKRALWFWESDQIKDDTAVAKFMSTITSKDNKISTVHVLIDRDMGNDVWASFITKCNSSGISVEALMGDKLWIKGQTTDDGPTLQHQLNWIEQYQASVPASAKFSGIHLDVEPWGLEENDWEANQKAYVGSLVEIVDTVVACADPLGLPVAADLPFWAHKVSCEEAALDTCLLPHLDSVTFMTYRNTPTELLAIAMPLLTTIHNTHPDKSVWFAVETDSQCAEAELISYAGKGAAKLFDDLDKVEEAAAKVLGNFGGVAIHSWGSLVEMGA